MTIALLSWGADKTLENTLKSYAYYGLHQQDTERIALLQQGTPEQAKLCYGYGFNPIVLSTNVGIANGYNLLLREATGEYFLFLENDWELIDDPQPQIGLGKLIMHQLGIDIVRYRSRRLPGSPLWTKQFEGREMDKPTHLLDSVYWTDKAINPINVYYTEEYLYNGEHLAMDDINPYMRVRTPWYYTSSKYANWTNNPHMAKTEFLREYIAPR